MKKQIERFKVRIDQNLNRTEKTVALSPELVKVGYSDNLKQVIGSIFVLNDVILRDIRNVPMAIRNWVNSPN